MRAMPLMATLFFYLFLFGCGGGDNGSNSTFAQSSLQLSASFYEVAEDAGELTVTVNRTDGTSGVVTVDYATSDGTGTAGVDYAATSGTLTFEDGVTSQSFVVGVIDDSVLEAGKTFGEVPLGLLSSSQFVLMVIFLSPGKQLLPPIAS